MKAKELAEKLMEHPDATVWYAASDLSSGEINSINYGPISKFNSIEYFCLDDMD